MPIHIFYRQLPEQRTLSTGGEMQGGVLELLELMKDST